MQCVTAVDMSTIALCIDGKHKAALVQLVFFIGSFWQQQLSGHSKRGLCYHHVMTAKSCTNSQYGQLLLWHSSQSGLIMGYDC